MRSATRDANPPNIQIGRFLQRLKRVTNSPVVRVLLFVVAIVGTVVGVRLVGAKQNSAQVTFVEFPQSGETTSPDGVETAPPSAMFSGEAFDTTARLREAAAFGLALSLTTFAEFAEKRVMHSTPESLLNGLIRRKLLPPGIEIDNGAAVANLRRFQLHYQPSPLRFEVLSEPAPNVHGPALLFRFPLQAANPGTITYFRSRSESAYKVPSPFSSPEQIVAKGWTIEQWQGQLLSLDESTIEALREQDQWLRSQK